jgi:hypothetical protein
MRPQMLTKFHANHFGGPRLLHAGGHTSLRHFQTLSSDPGTSYIYLHILNARRCRQREGIVMSEGSQASPARPFDKGGVRVKALEVSEAVA